jgi:hypothetical protein
MTTTRFVSWLTLAVLGGAVCSTRLARGAEPESAGDETGTAESAPADERAGANERPGALAPGADSTLIADAEAGGSPVENPGQAYRFVGLRYRGLIVPKFMMNLFGDGGATVYVHSFGPEFAIRKDAFEYNFGLWYASYAMSPTAFKASTDTAQAWEIVESEIKAIYLTADFLWSHDFTPEFAFNYGLGAGFGIIFGDLFRTQAYRGPGGNDNTGEGFLPCSAQGLPDPNYCGSDNDHYAGYKEPSWADGGSKPIVFPWLVLQTGLRYKPHRNFVSRLDAGFGTSGFFVGIGADYGI